MGQVRRDVRDVVGLVALLAVAVWRPAQGEMIQGGTRKARYEARLLAMI